MQARAGLGLGRGYSGRAFLISGKRIDVLTTREQWQAIEQYAKCHGLRWGEAVRELIEQALEQEKE